MPSWILKIRDHTPYLAGHQEPDAFRNLAARPCVEYVAHTHGKANGVDASLCDPCPVVLGDPGIPVLFKHGLRICASRHVEIALTRCSSQAKGTIGDPAL